MSIVDGAVIAMISEPVVLLAIVGAGWHLLRQGGGIQVKTPPPKKAANPVPEAAPELRRAA